jgi:hypothetical protein
MFSSQDEWIQDLAPLLARVDNLRQRPEIAELFGWKR